MHSSQRFVVMGVAGSGKTLIGSALARGLGVEFVEGDDHHPAANVAKMAAGIPLDDGDRREWLAALAARIAAARAAGVGLVVSCSALKRKYRDVLRAADPAVRFVHLVGTRPLLGERIAARSGHFMPASLLDSQLATLEPPVEDEDAWVFDASLPAAAIVDDLLARTAR